METPPPFQVPQQALAGLPPKRVRFEVISEGWKLYMADFGQWITSVLLVGLIIAIPTMAIQFALTLGTRGSGSFDPAKLAEPNPTANVVVQIVMVPVMAAAQLLIAGCFRRGLLCLRGIPAPVGEIFNLQGMGPQIYVYGLLVGLIGLPTQLLLAFANPLTGTAWLYFIAVPLYLVDLVFQALLVITPLIIVDQKLKASDAMMLSIRTLLPHFFSLAAMLFVLGLLSISGMIACLIGVIFTGPVVYPAIAILYNDFFRPRVPAPVDNTGFYPRPMG